MSEKKRNKDNEERKSPGENRIEVKGEEAEQEKSQPENQKAKEPAGEKKEPTPLEKLQQQLDEKTREAAENCDKWLRLRAEFENFKKRMQKEKADLMKFSNESLLKSILPILPSRFLIRSAKAVYLVWSLVMGRRGVLPMKRMVLSPETFQFRSTFLNL